MKISYTLISFLSMGSVVFAQPMITEVNMPQIGDQPAVTYCTDVPVESTLDAQTGANYTWDFSTLVTESTQGFDFVDPSTTLWASAFTGSDICGVDDATDARAYYSSNSSALSTTGFRLVLSPGDTFAVNYTDVEQIIDFPFTYNDNATDAFSGNGLAGGFAVTLAGSITYTADGYGSLILPNATYNNVIRYRMDRSEVTSFSGNPTGTIVKDQWIWISADHRYWLLLMELVDDGFGVDDNVWYQSSPLPALPTGIEETAAKALRLFPNPVAANGTVQVGRLLAADETAQLWDVSGRMVRNFASNTATLSLQGVGAGVYLLKVSNKSRTISTQKLIVQ